MATFIKTLPGGRGEIHHQCFHVLRAAEALLAGVIDGRMDLETESLIVESGDSVADDEIGQFGDGLANDLRVGIHLSACDGAGDLHGGAVLNVEDDAPFDVAADLNHGGGGPALVGFLVHGNIGNRDGAGQGLGEHGVGGVDEWLNQLHPHKTTPLFR